MTTDVGLVSLDTSHGEAFANALAGRSDARPAAIWDDGMVRDGSYVEAFRSDYGTTRYDRPDGMVDHVDAVMVLSVDWERHLALATPFLDAGVPTCIDKPIAGCIDDLDAIAAEADETPLFGGSALPYHPAFADIPTDRPGRRLFCVGYEDPFYYGAHLADIACHFAGSDWSVVESGGGPGEFDVVFENESRVRLALDGPDAGAAFGLLDASDRVRSAVAGSDGNSYTEMYRRYLAAFLATVRGDRDPTAPLTGARLLLAMEAAREHDEPITADSDALEHVDVESTDFVAEYSPYY